MSRVSAVRYATKGAWPKSGVNLIAGEPKNTALESRRAFRSFIQACNYVSVKLSLGLHR